jgi:hypothetical protein
MRASLYWPSSGQTVSEFLIRCNECTVTEFRATLAILAVQLPAIAGLVGLKLLVTL